MKEYLSHKGLQYTDYDVAADTNARHEMSTKTGSMSVPTLVINGNTIIGFDRTKIEQFLH